MHQVSLRAFDLSERAGQSQQRRVQRWREHLFMMTQVALAAGLAWWLGQNLLGHKVPFFASVAAIIIILAGLVPVILVSRSLDRPR